MNRRYFIMGSAIASHSVFGQTAGKQVGTAMIGVGNRGSYLLKEVMAQPDVKVVALCDNKPDRLDKAATAAASFKPSTTADWRKIIERKDVDAVFIATPPYLHAEMAIAALKAGKNVYCEKPIGLTAESIKELIRTAKQSNQVFQSGQQMRSLRQFGDAVKKIHEGAIGDILFVKAQRHASAEQGYNSSSSDWYFEYKKSGGYLVEQSVHNLDACNWAIGQHPTRAAGFGGTNLHKHEPTGRDILDHASVTFEYANGVQLNFTQMVYHPRSMPNGNQMIYVYGSKGSVELLNTATYYPLDNAEKPSVLSPKVEEKSDAHIAAFYECIRTGAKPSADVTIGATAALTAIMAHDTCVQGRVVNWSDFGVEI